MESIHVVEVGLNGYTTRHTECFMNSVTICWSYKKISKMNFASFIFTSGMKEKNENLHTNNFHNPFTSFGCDDDVIFLITKF